MNLYHPHLLCGHNLWFFNDFIHTISNIILFSTLYPVSLPPLIHIVSYILVFTFILKWICLILCMFAYEFYEILICMHRLNLI